jgi:hypothetical protein
MKIIEVEVKHKTEDGNKIVELQLKKSDHCVLVSVRRLLDSLESLGFDGRLLDF